MKRFLLKILIGIGISVIVLGCAAQAPIDPHAALIRSAIQMGFHQRKIDGGVSWCHSIVPMGSLLAREECMTEERLSQFLRQQEDNRDTLSRPTQCGSGGYCSGG